MERSLPAIALLTLSLTVAAAQQNQTSLETLKARTGLVYVDVTVTDQDHHAIHALKASEFTLHEDGAVQTINSFEEHLIATGDVERKFAPLPPGTFSNATAVPTTGPVTVLLIDRLSSTIAFQTWTNVQLMKYIKTLLKPGTPVAILGMNLHLEFIQGFTTDPDVLIAAIRSLSSPRQSPLMEPDCADIRKSAAGSQGIDLCLPPPTPDAQRARQDIARSNLVEAYRDLARYLSSIPGRKNVIAVSDSGMVAHELQGDPTPPMYRHPSLTKLYDENHIAVHWVGHDGQGQLFYAPEDVERVVDDGASYYTLTYSPTNKNLDGTFRNIQVAIAKRGLTLSYRKGYYSDDAHANAEHASLAPAPGAAAQTSTRHHLVDIAMLHGMPAPTEIVFKVAIAPGSDPNERLIAAGNETGPKTHGPFRNYEIRYSVPLDAVALTGGSGVNLEFVAIVYDPAGNFVNSSVEPIKATLTANAIANMRRTGLQFRQQISVPAKGDYFLRIAVHDRASDKVGALELPVNMIKDLPVDAPAGTHPQK